MDLSLLTLKGGRSMIISLAEMVVNPIRKSAEKMKVFISEESKVKYMIIYAGINVINILNNKL